jgi:signal transduction histidine kinase
MAEENTGKPLTARPRTSFFVVNALRAGLIVFLVTLGVLLLMYYQARSIVRNEARDYLVSVASIVASMVDGDLHETFTDPGQEVTPEYAAAIDPLRRILSSNDELRFVYTMRRIDNGYYFVLDGAPWGDADSDGVEDHSPIMQRFPDEDVTPQMRLAFDTGLATSDFRTEPDSWGIFLSGYAPIFDSRGKLVGIAGVGISEETFRQHISRLLIGFHIGLAVSLVLSLLSAWLVSIFRKSSRRAGQELLEAAGVLAGSEARYRSLFENSPAALWELDCSEVRRIVEERLASAAILDLEGLFRAQPGLAAECLATTRVLAMNRAARLLYEAGDSHPEHILQVLYTDRSYDLFEKLISCVIGQSDSGSGEDERRTLGGRRITVLVNWIVAPGYEQRHDRIYVSELDVTDLRMTEVARRLLEEQFLQAQKMESVGRLAGGVAHDINNMLTPVLGYTELARDSLPDGLVAKVHLEQVRESAMRIRDLVGQLLAFARRQSLRIEPVSLQAELESFAGALSRILGGEIEVEYILDPATPVIRADRVQIQQVVLNLVVNAKDAMPDGGTLRIRSGREVISGYVDMGGEPLAPGVYAVLRVEDTGMGMGSETLAHLFEPFFTTKPAGEGTGLGLSTVYGIVRQHGGGIAVNSTPGEGTAFILLFPAADQGDPKAGS